MKENNAKKNNKQSKWQKKYVDKVRIILRSQDYLLTNAMESTIDVLFEVVIKEANRIKYY